MSVFGLKSTFLELSILAAQKRELIIEEVHNDSSFRFRNSVRPGMLLWPSESPAALRSWLNKPWLLDKAWPHVHL